MIELSLASIHAWNEVFVTVAAKLTPLSVTSRISPLATATPSAVTLPLSYKIVTLEEPVIGVYPKLLIVSLFSFPSVPVSMEMVKLAPAFTDTLLLPLSPVQAVSFINNSFTFDFSQSKEIFALVEPVLITVMVSVADSSQPAFTENVYF